MTYTIRSERDGAISSEQLGDGETAIFRAKEIWCRGAEYVEVTDSTGAMVWDSELGRHEGGY